MTKARVGYLVSSLNNLYIARDMVFFPYYQNSSLVLVIWFNYECIEYALGDGYYAKILGLLICYKKFQGFIMHLKIRQEFFLIYYEVLLNFISD